MWKQIIASKYGVQLDGSSCLVRGPFVTSHWKGIMNFYIESGSGQWPGEELLGG